MHAYNFYDKTKLFSSCWHGGGCALPQKKLWFLHAVNYVPSYALLSPPQNPVFSKIRKSAAGRSSWKIYALHTSSSVAGTTAMAWHDMTMHGQAVVNK